MSARRIARRLLLVVIAVAGLLAIEAGVAVWTVPDDGYSAPAAGPRSFGATGARPPLRYVVLGDSTSTGRGAPYERGIAVATARHLARDAPVTLVNLGVSGARFGDVRREQLPEAVRLTPHVVLLAAGANDVTGLTSAGSVGDDLARVAGDLRSARCDVAIVATGSPDIGSVPRLAQPLRALAGRRTEQLNAAIAEVARERGLELAPVAERTGRRFRADRSLFAADGFHPSAAGYGTWVPVIEAALDRALARADTRDACPYEDPSVAGGVTPGAGARDRLACEEEEPEAVNTVLSSVVPSTSEAVFADVLGCAGRSRRCVQAGATRPASASPGRAVAGTPAATAVRTPDRPAWQACRERPP